MATIEMRESSFNEIIDGNDLVIIDFWAEWCGPCRAYAPVFERVSDLFPEVVFAKVDTEVEKAVAGSFGIRSIPTLMIFKNGQPVGTQIGAISKQQLLEFIQSEI